MKTKHTHKGHCQICGRLHAVDNATGLLSDHGYVLPPHWHQRNGSCAGAVAAPYEQSRDLIPAFIKYLEDSAQRHREQAADIAANGTDDRDMGTERMNLTIRRTAGGVLVLRKWKHQDAWARHAGKPREMASEEPAVDYFAALNVSADTAKSVAADWYASGCRNLVWEHAHKAEQCEADARRWQKRFDAWVPDAPLTEVKRNPA